ncbi:MAG: hypothetical protein AAF950_06905 [Pseudomonadota bacterium]
MKTPFRRLSAIILFGIFLFYPQAGLSQTSQQTESFTSGRMLAEWSEDGQDSFFQTSIGMAGAIATQNDGQKARCINDWYFKDGATKAERNEAIRQTLARFPEYHPTVTLLAIVEKACGSFSFEFESPE